LTAKYTAIDTREVSSLCASYLYLCVCLLSSVCLCVVCFYLYGYVFECVCMCGFLFVSLLFNFFLEVAGFVGEVYRHRHPGGRQFLAISFIFVFFYSPLCLSVVYFRCVYVWISLRRSGVIWQRNIPPSTPGR
jgi:hypothetical protein